jgi:diguanylate cyclase (GGDEF)-like protein/PAS domain S-box-containing protein
LVIVSSQEEVGDADCLNTYSIDDINDPGPFSVPDSLKIQQFEQIVFAAMARAEKLRLAFQAETTFSGAFVETILKELQTLIEELQMNFQEIWVQPEVALLENQAQAFEKNQRYRTFFEVVPEGALFTDGEAFIKAANQAFGQILHWPESWLVGQSLLAWMPPERQADLRLHLQTLHQQGAVQNWETVLRRRDGVMVQVALSVKQCPPPHGDEFCWLVRNRSPSPDSETPSAPSQGQAEHNIEQRTAALAIVNQQLQAEIEARKQAEQALQFQARQNQLVHDIASRIRSSLELNQVLQATVTEVRQLLDVDRVIVLQFEAINTKLVATEARNECYPSLLAQAYKEPCFQAQGIEHYRQGRVRAFEDILAEAVQLHPCLVETLKSHDVRALLLVPILQHDQVWGMLVAHHCRCPRPWPDYEQTLLTRLSTQVSIAIQQSALYDETRRLSRVDRLTQIANRGWFDDYLGQMWKQHQREQAPLALVFIDIDFFKAYNDTYGHPAGDSCLRTVAQLLNRHAKRPNDLVARYGGEEFAAILPNTNLMGAQHIAETALDGLRRLGLPHQASPLKLLTMSVGVISLIPTVGQQVSDLIQGADQALYEAKAGGRNRVVVWSVEGGAAKAAFP